MKTYLVGGAVRDRMLGREIKDLDYVVVGSSPEAMLNKGFTQVGKDFPVFLHPDTKDEWALARKEVTTGHGYGDFQFDFSPTVTLKEDLYRRDFTINAMAQDMDSGEVIDPFNGQADLHNKVLRHVSEHFVEDPLRVLRAARFMARYAEYGFTIAEETLSLMRRIVSTTGEVINSYLLVFQAQQRQHMLKLTQRKANAMSLDEKEQAMLAVLEQTHIEQEALYSIMGTLSPERIYQEVKGALTTTHPHVFFDVLDKVGALAVLFPELHALKGQTQPEDYHPEIDTFVHQMMVLQQARALSDDHDVLMAALCHDFGKGLTPVWMLPRHTGHEGAGVPIVDAFCRRFRVANKTHKLAALMSEYHTHIHKAPSLTAKKMMEVFAASSAFTNNSGMLEKLCIASEADARGRLGLEKREYPSREYVMRLFRVGITAYWTQEQLMAHEPVKRKDFIFEQRLGRVRRAITLEKGEVGVQVVTDKLLAIVNSNLHRRIVMLMKYNVEHHLAYLEEDIAVATLKPVHCEQLLLWAKTINRAYAEFIADGGKDNNWVGKKDLYTKRLRSV